MSRILYYIVLIPLSLLPYTLLYFFSDVSFLFIYHLFKYRRSVVRDNLVKAFPLKSDEEIIDIEKKFYHHLCDLMVESIKNFTISEKEAKSE